MQSRRSRRATPKSSFEALVASALGLALTAGGLTACKGRSAPQPDPCQAEGAECDAAVSVAGREDAAVSGGRDASVIDAGLGLDAGRNGGTDAGRDGGTDAGRDGGTDAGRDGGTTARTDAGVSSLCASAVPVALNSVTSGNTTGGGRSRHQPRCIEDQNSAPERVFLLTVPERLDSLVIAMWGSDYDTVISVYQGCGTGTVLGCNDDSDSLRSRLELGPVEPGQYTIVVEGYQDAVGQFQMSVEGTPEGAECTRNPSACGAPVGITAGSQHTCVSTLRGIVCFGANDTQQLGPPSSSPDENGMLLVPELPSPRLLRAGGAHTCAVVDHETICWGANDRGQLTQTENAIGEFIVATSTPAASLAAGRAHTCIATLAGQVLCWGANEAGQLGDGQQNDSAVPVTVTGLPALALDVSAGEAYTCARLSDGSVACWGGNNFGQLGDGSGVDQLQPVTVNGVIAAEQIATGEAHACAIETGGTVRCWGSNALGQLGAGLMEPDSPTPVAVSLPAPAIAIGAGARHTCAILEGGGMACWGDNEMGQLGVLGVASSTTAVTVESVSSAQALALGESHTCAALTTGLRLCFGRNDMHQLGDGSTENRSAPVGVGITPVDPTGELRNWMAIGPFTSTVACGLPQHSGLAERTPNPFPRASQSFFPRTNQYWGDAWFQVGSMCVDTTCGSDASINMTCQLGPSGGQFDYAYAFAYVYSPNDREVVLSVATQSGVAAFLNGTEVALSGQNNCGMCDSSAPSRAPVALRSGINRLLVKVAHSSQGSAFNLRFETPGGDPVTDLATTILPP